MKNKNPDQPLRNLNIFLLTKAINGIITDYSDIKFIKGGNILILTKNEQQANKLLKAKKLANICEIQCKLHPTLNYTKGIIYAPMITNLTEQEIVSELADQGVTQCKRITKITNNGIKDTPLHILSFNTFHLPKEINIGFLKVKVDQYIPKPMQCKNCHKIGHTAKNCRNKKTCEICTEEHEKPTECKKIICINCNGEHRATNTNCPTIQKAKDLIKLKITKKWSFSQTTQYLKQNPHLTPIYNSPKETLEEAKKTLINKMEKLKLVSIKIDDKQTLKNTYQNNTQHTNKEETALNNKLKLIKNHNNNNFYNINAPTTQIDSYTELREPEPQL